MTSRRPVGGPRWFRRSAAVPRRTVEAADAAPSSAVTDTEPRAATLLSLVLTFLRIGGTVFGGMWAATGTLERELVERRRWLTNDELRTFYVVATLIPAPRFMGLAGLVGFRVGSWSGAFLSVVALVLPTSALVVAGIVFIRPELLQGALAPLNRAIGVAVVGLLFGNAYQQLREGMAQGGRNSVVGVVLAASVLGAILAGVPLLVAAIVGFGLGALLIRDKGVEEPLEDMPEVSDG